MFRRAGRPDISYTGAMAGPRIGVVGATGAVGTITLELLAERGYAVCASIRRLRERTTPPMAIAAKHPISTTSASEKTARRSA